MLHHIRIRSFELISSEEYYIELSVGEYLVDKTHSHSGSENALNSFTKSFKSVNFLYRQRPKDEIYDHEKG